ncbi:diacylglycerol O-acyltransferase 2-like [Polyodon spathula]|uniref:diacylglycerol O-acyltransferase 2-like n=1 Tax=Polyodon spathula TaxID=7913 RepID=UPI001B7E52C7|nr:diacylglycerol O-acyltransferase 2-like [Polyodon spathula]
MSPVPVSMKPWTQELIEKLSVLQWVLTFLGMGIFCSILVISLLFTRLWTLSVLYFTWLVLDWDSPENWSRPSKWIRGWSLWKHFSNYYPIKLVKTAELSPERNYVFGCHPHGIMCAGAFSNFSTEGTGFSTMFPGIRPHLATLAGMFKMPIYREYMMCAGERQQTRKQTNTHSRGMWSGEQPSLKYHLSQNGSGNAVAIVIGGAAESLNCSPGHNSLVMRNRKGFVKLRFPVTDGVVAVGKPITVLKMVSPPDRVVDHYHRLYMQAVLDLFDRHKVACGLSEESQLEIL